MILEVKAICETKQQKLPTYSIDNKTMEHRFLILKYILPSGQTTQLLYVFTTKYFYGNGKTSPLYMKMEE